jgi:hypothetical protein
MVALLSPRRAAVVAFLGKASIGQRAMQPADDCRVALRAIPRAPFAPSAATCQQPAAAATGFVLPRSRVFIDNFVGHEYELWAVAASADGAARLRQRRSLLPLGNLKTCELIATKTGAMGSVATPQGHSTSMPGADQSLVWQTTRGPMKLRRSWGRTRKPARRRSKRNTGVEGVFGKPQIAEPTVSVRCASSAMRTCRGPWATGAAARQTLSCPSKP